MGRLEWQATMRLRHRCGIAWVSRGPLARITFSWHNEVGTALSCIGEIRTRSRKGVA